MSLSTHVLAKDLRRYWPLAAFAAAFIALEMMAPLWSFTPGFLNIGEDSALMAITEWPIIFVLIVAVMQEDLTIGDKAFWRTRPIAPLPLLMGKLLLFGLAVAVPAILANVWIAAALDMPGPVTLGIAVETTGFMLLMVLCAALLASMTRNLLHAALAALGAVIVVVVIGATRDALSKTVHIHLPWDTDVADPRPRVAFACALACVALVALLAHQFLTRRTLRTLLLLVLAVPIILFTAVTWTMEVGVQLPRMLVMPEKPLQQTDGITLTMELPAQVNGQSWAFDAVTHRNHPVYNIAAYTDLHGAPAGRLFGIVGESSTLRLSDGREIKFDPAQQWFNTGWGNTEREGAICRGLGLRIPVVPGKEDPQGLIRLFQLPKKQLEELKGVRGQLTARLMLGEQAFRQDFLMPARAGARHMEPGRMWRIVRIFPDDDATLHVDLQFIRATTMFDSGGAARADIDAQPFAGRLFYLLNRKLGQYAAGNVYWGNGRLGTVASVEAKMNFRARRSDGAEISSAPFDEAWLADAELAVISIEPVGKTEKTVVVDNFEIPAESQ